MWPAAGVTATSPATMPEASPSDVTFPWCQRSTSIHIKPAAAAAACVVVKASPAMGAGHGRLDGHRAAGVEAEPAEPQAAPRP